MELIVKIALNGGKATQVINLQNEAYKYIVSTETPQQYKEKGWSNLSKNQRIKWHCDNISSHLGGKLLEYTIIEE